MAQRENDRQFVISSNPRFEIPKQRRASREKKKKKKSFSEMMLLRVQNLLANRQGMGSSSKMSEEEKAALFARLLTQRMRVLEDGCKEDCLDLRDKQDPSEIVAARGGEELTAEGERIRRWVVDKGAVDACRADKARGKHGRKGMDFRLPEKCLKVP